MSTRWQPWRERKGGLDTEKMSVAASEQLVDDADSGETVDELFQNVYQELRHLAEDYMRRESAGHTLQPTALVHEAFLRLSGQHYARWKSRSHFFAVGATVMQRLLIDHARKRSAARRGAGWKREVLDHEHEQESCQNQEIDQEQLLMVNHALDKLAAVDKRGAQVVALRIFAGMTVVEVAEALDISPRTVNEDWRHALAWLRLELASTHDA